MRRASSRVTARAGRGGHPCTGVTWSVCLRLQQGEERDPVERQPGVASAPQTHPRLGGVGSRDGESATHGGWANEEVY